MPETLWQDCRSSHDRSGERTTAGFIDPGDTRDA